MIHHPQWPKATRAPASEPPIPFEPYLRIRSAGGAAFCADKPLLAFLSNESGLTQLWSLDLATMQAEQRTFGPERVTFATCAPAGDSLIFGSDVGGNERAQFHLVDPQTWEAVPITNRPDALHRWGRWTRDGRSFAFSSNARDPQFFDVYLQELPRGDARLVLQHDGHNSPIAWAPDARSLIVSRWYTPSNNDLYQLDLATGELRHLTPHRGEARYGAVDWTLDGRYLTLITDHERDHLALALLDLSDGSLRMIAEPKWDVEAARLSHDGRLLAWRSNENGYSVLRIRDMATGVDAPLPPIPAGVITDMRWSPDSRRLAFGLSAFNQNSDAWMLDLDQPSLTRLTFSSLAGLASETFVAPEPVHYRSFDGLEVPGLLYRPPNHSRSEPLPVILHVHGGPESQVRPEFYATFQYFVQRGYAVFAPNVRGSTGYGNRYSHLDDARRRMDSVADLEAAWRWIVDSGLGDPRRVAIMGGSYGGFMVLSALVTYPDLWAAGVDIVGISNFITFLENTGPYRRTLREAEYGSLERDADFLRSISPIHQVDRIRAPLMVVHGANDPRVPIGEAEQIVASLRDRDAPVEYLRFENEGHGLVRLDNRLAAYPAIADFLDRTLGV